jgi:ubiquinone/menaquinone biosynthesis C-methylase UbiE
MLMSVEANVSERYAQGAMERQEALCCPVSYNPALLKKLPQEIIDKDYGCGDPSRYVRPGDTVLDLGSGGGKVCYMAAQVVGEQGTVIGIDMTDEMLSLANKYKTEMAETLGGDRVEFRKGYIQDLALDVNAMDIFLENNPIANAGDLKALQNWQQEQKKNQPLVASNSVDLVISNCVLNLVDEDDRKQMISEIFRVLKPGGRVAISDIVSDERVPKHLKADQQLWSGCISGAFQEKEFLDAFVDAGFVAVGYDKWDQEPWQVVESVEFRSVTLEATKPSKSGLTDNGHAVIYRGPYKVVHDDLGNYYPRGERIAVSLRTYQLLVEGTYQADFIGIEPAEKINGGCFCLPAGTLRPASMTKGGSHAGASEKGCC